jgi:hypothetical protein
VHLCPKYHKLPTDASSVEGIFRAVGKPAKHRPHRPRLPSWSRNTCKPPHFYAVDKRAVLMGAVGIHPMAVDNSGQYRPQESPANRRINEGAVDAGGTMRRLLGTSFFLPRPPQRPVPFRAASSAFVAEEMTLEDLGGPNVVLLAFKAASTHTSVRPTRPLVADRGANSCYPSQAGPFRCTQGRGVRRKGHPWGWRGRKCPVVWRRLYPFPVHR